VDPCPDCFPIAQACVVVEFFGNKRSSYRSKQASFPVEITSELIGDLSGR
jgi:hypothetical protein